MKDNPFLSDTFTRIWSKHFNKDKPTYIFKFIANLSFTKSTWLPIYCNIGKNHTKGISYSLVPDQSTDFARGVFLIYDVPTFFNLKINNSNKKLGLIKIKQYQGFLVELLNYSDFNQYFSSAFSKSSRYKLNKYKKRLESCFDISYKMYYGAIDPDQYNTIFVHFKQLLEKRFLDKGTTNNNLDPKEWNFYTEVAYPMILEKKASLFVIYNGDTPIGVTLNYFSDTIVFDAITVFDIDYEKFHLGSVSIMKLIEWSINQKFKYFDFSKGHFDYKKRWANKEYYFEYHLYYDKSSIISSALGNTIALYFNLKQYFREKNLNVKFHKLTFWFRNLQAKKNENEKYFSMPIGDEINLEKYIEINRDSDEWIHLKANIFEFLYLNNSSEKDLKVKKNTLDKNSFVLECNDRRVMLTMLKSN
ncbi:GNAT family N-acetyltransferase [Arenibacter sp. N53]|uniref:GNAT family N-acetyltransferase n=1 Tax=Arenibacter TaxID=178469 RepID=UPI000CD483B3|nr:MULTISPECIES: GNAT family N-acetyltransferase [Arenibacter]MCM4154267.1 GNAT family N-acetyltransferase [Arenibacter sp. N53]